MLTKIFRDNFWSIEKSANAFPITYNGSNNCIGNHINSLYGFQLNFTYIITKFVEALAGDKFVLPEIREKASITLADRKLLTIHTGRKKYYKLTDKETIKDIKEHSVTSSTIEAGLVFKALSWHIS